jgi:phosphoglycerate dehydrogenase-like enzyme
MPTELAPTAARPPGLREGVVRTFLEDALPGVCLEAVEADVLRRGFSADVLLPAMSRLDGALMDAISGLRLVQQWGAGLEGVDIAAATARGIAVANVPTAGTGNAESVAEWCVLAALALSRRLREAERLIHAGTGWGIPAGRALLGRTAGIVGLGGIGRALALRLKPFGMRLMAVRRRPDPALAAELGLDWLGGMDELPALLRQSDYLFLCVPLSPETRGLLDARALGLLPPGAVVVNPGRGGVVPEADLLEALSAGRLAGASLDVFEREPLDPCSPLLSRDDVLATPHIAGVTDASYGGIARAVAENVRRLLSGEPLRNCVNAEALRARR